MQPPDEREPMLLCLHCARRYPRVAGGCPRCVAPEAPEPPQPPTFMKEPQSPSRGATPFGAFMWVVLLACLAALLLKAFALYVITTYSWMK